MATSLSPLDSETIPSVEELIDRARALRPVLAGRAQEAERDGRVSEDTMRQMVAAGLHRLGQPRRFGGCGYPPSAMLEVGFELGRACASAAWCAMITNANAWFAAYWPLEVQQEIWGDSPDSLVAIAGVPTGKCRAVEDGYEIWGRWPFVSNCDHSDWAIVSAPLSETEGVPPETTWFMVRLADLQIDPDSWNVSGLSGTGSKTLVGSEPLFVPRNHIVKLSEVIQDTTPGRSIPGNNMAAFNFATLGGVTLVAPLLGAAQGALDWFIETMKTKVKTSIKAGASAPASLTPAIQARVGDASARIDAAMALLRTGLERFEPKVASGEPVCVADRVSVRRDIGFAARQASDAVTILFEGAGASSMALDVPIQRFWRDIGAGARHVTLDVDGIYAMVGQERFGLAPVGPH